MKEVVVLSGKGGTGKTSIAGSLAALAKNKVLVDCDVDAADLHLLLAPETKEEHDFRSGLVAVIDREKCTQCGLCAELCRFGAIDDFTVDTIACEGCGFCSQVCPADAIMMEERLSGRWFVSATKYGPLVHARLGIGQENSGKLVTTVRQEARKLAEKREATLIISDGPPGIGCPVISSLSGVDLAVLVTEPTLSGRHDLERVHGVCTHFGVTSLVCVNKYDINEENTRNIEDYCRENGIAVGARIPYDSAVTGAVTRGVPVVEHGRSAAAGAIEKLWGQISAILAG